MKMRKNNGFTDRLSFILIDNLEYVIEIGALAVGFALFCIFPTGIFDKWPDLAILIGAAIVLIIIGLVAFAIHIIKRVKKR